MGNTKAIIASQTTLGKLAGITHASLLDAQAQLKQDFETRHQELLQNVSVLNDRAGIEKIQEKSPTVTATVAVPASAAAQSSVQVTRTRSK